MPKKSKSVFLDKQTGRNIELDIDKKGNPLVAYPDRYEALTPVVEDYADNPAFEAEKNSISD